MMLRTVWWKNNGNEFRSDIYDVCGDYPAVFGWDVGHLELGKTMNLDSVKFDFMKKMISKIHERGGLNTISWHLNEPITGQSSWTQNSIVEHILPKGSHHQVYRGWLKNLANFFLSLRDAEGELVPVVFRPYHEMNGSWFWWGGKNCTPHQFKALWRMTTDVLRNEYNVSNLLLAYSPNSVVNKEEFMLRYPGDEYVDVLGIDIYDRTGNENRFVKPLLISLEILKDIAHEKGKLFALTETGRDQVPEANWWTRILYPAIKNSGISWVLLWRNAWPSHYYVPYPGQISEKDFIEFYKKPDVLFLTDLVKLNK